MPEPPLTDALREAAGQVGMPQALAVALAGQAVADAPPWAQRLVDAARAAPDQLAAAYERLVPNRVAQGAFYTPRPLVLLAHRLVEGALRAGDLAPESTALVDPACGAGAFFALPPARRYARRIGLDRDASALVLAAPHADEVRCADAYTDGLLWLSERVRALGRPVAVVGNPPYRGDSALLGTGRYREIRDALLPFAREVPLGRSLRDDYVLFFGVADRLVDAAGSGAISFVTSATFLSNYLYRPMRRHLLSRYRLVASVELGPGFFEDARVDTVLTVWLRDRRARRRPAFRRWDVAAQAEEGPGERALRLALVEAAAESPAAAAWQEARPFGEALLLRVPDDRTASTLAQMAHRADPIGRVVAFSTPGLKTRFDELLVADHREELVERMRAFFSALGEPHAFAREWGIAAGHRAKLAALAEASSQNGARFDPAAIRPYIRYAGPRHRFGIPPSAMQFVYFDRRLIPRGDHRLRGEYDPHRGHPKLVFNVREVPLAAAVVAREGCVHDWRHARFAPLFVPVGLLARGRGGPTGPRVANLAPHWQRATDYLGGEERVFDFLCGVVNSALVQRVFAPWLGAAEEPPIRRVTTRNRAAARRVADATRILRLQAEAGAPLSGEARSALDAAVARLYGVETAAEA